MTDTEEVLDLVRRWAAAKAGNDGTALDAILEDDFAGVGPVGFVLSRKQWLGRFDNGLRNQTLEVQDPQVRLFGDTAVVIGIQAQQTQAKGQDASGRFRVSLVVVRRAGGWFLANLHIGPLTYPGAKPSE